MAKGSETGGCLNCYAARVATRFAYDEHGPFHGFARITENGPRWTGKVELVEKHLADPLHWHKPRRIFVNSMSDLFHEALPDEAIDRVFAVMSLCKQHQFQVLTKRPERMLAYFSEKRPEILDDLFLTNKVPEGWYSHLRFVQPDGLCNWPLRNVWLGVSCENQEMAAARIPLLLQTPAAIRFVSYEPALGPVDFTWLPVGFNGFSGQCVRTWDALRGTSTVHDPVFGAGGVAPAKLDWVIAGFESGPGARPANEEWIRAVKNQCVDAAVAFFYKQSAVKGRKIPTPELDGQRWVQFPGEKA